MSMYTPLKNEKKNRKFSACTIGSLTIRAASATVVHTVEQPEIEYKILVIKGPIGKMRIRRTIIFRKNISRYLYTERYFSSKI